MATRSLWLQNVDYSAHDDRRLISWLATEGVLDTAIPLPTSFTVAPRGAGANLSVDIHPGDAVIQGQDMSDQNRYLVRSDAIVNLTGFAPAPASGSRTDLVVARIRDSAVTGAQDGLFFEIEAGTTVKPPSSLALAEVTLNAGDAAIEASNIVDRRIWATSRVAHRPHAHPHAAAYMRRTSVLNVNHNATTEVKPFTTSEVHGDVTANTATGRVTIQTAGLYEVHGHIQWQANWEGARYAIITVGGVETARSLLYLPAGVTSIPSQQVAAPTTWLDVGDSVGLSGYQASGSSRNIAVAWLSATLISTGEET